MEYYETTLSRANEDDLKVAMDEKVEDGWEVILGITPVYKTSNKLQRGSYTVTKYICRVRKEARKARAGRLAN